MRHAAATGAAIAAFLAMYFGLSLAVWAALALAVCVYAALLLLIPARPEAAEPFDAEAARAADLREAHAQLRGAAARLRGGAKTAPRPEDKALAETLAGRVEELDRILSEDPSHLKVLRRFAKVFLPRMTENFDSWLRLARSSDPALAPRIAALRGRIEAYPEAVGSVIRAALGDDLMALEAEVEALSQQIER